MYSIYYRLRVFWPILWIAGMLSVTFFQSCSTGPDGGCRGDIIIPCIPEEEPHKRLSDYSLFRGNLNNLEPADRLLPYDLNTPLFSDYADKFRMVYLPEGTSTAYKDSGVLTFPVGSVLVKTFFYNLKPLAVSSDRQIIETRLLIRNKAGWTAETYVWNEEQNEAFLQQTGDNRMITFVNEEGITKKVNYIIPTKNDCKTCHSQNNTLIPIGPKVSNLNKDYSYSDGVDNQLVRWEQHGILRNRPELREIPESPVWDDSSTGTVENRARMYLDVNCAHCHSPGGSANNSALFLSSDEKDPLRVGVCKSPVATGAGSGGLRFDIVPCQPDNSIMLFRMTSVEPDKRMPELGRTLVHEEGVQLIEEWIKNMDCISCNRTQ